ICRTQILSARSRSTDKFISGAVYRQNETRLVRFRLDFLAQAHDMGIDRASRRKPVIAPDLFEQPVATQGLTGMAQKIFQEFEFLSGKIQRLAAATHLTALEIDLQIPERISLLLLRERARAA